jgi:acetamidase/formamidase
VAVTHELPLERRTLHGHFSPALTPVLEISAGDRVRFSAPDAGWGLVPPRLDGSRRDQLVERDPHLDSGHALVGPIWVREARAGGTLAVTIEELRVGGYGWTSAGGWSTPLNDRLGVSGPPQHVLVWTINDDRTLATDQHGRCLQLSPFLGLVGMPPPEPGIHPTHPPRRWGGNIDCNELGPGTTLYLPIPVDGALLSLGDAHARQGHGEPSSTAIETPTEHAQIRIDLDQRQLSTPIARTPNAWLSFGFHTDLDHAATIALEAMLELMNHEHGLERRDALALASIIVDLHVTQLVNGTKGAHAVLPDSSLHTGTPSNRS